MDVTAVYPGTFDPLTNGHVDVAGRASRMFHRVIISVAENPGKQPFFDVEERVHLAEAAFADFPNIDVRPFSTLLVDYARDQGAGVILRGLRAVSDFEFEVQLSGMNRQLAPDIETLFIAAAQQYGFVSSSLVREIASLGGDISEFVPPAVKQALDRRFDGRGTANERE
ncbi:MAG: pantetheine-phosphate adenylyltransferase [Halofilum sp. (in: g-proteobacteria)]|nr:pantetheine-phosphate adenylyltransferase [Halofilum sp. (in: g-proteobacteria)]